MAFVYLLRCADDSLYCGWSTDLGARLARHAEGTGARYTASRRPVALAAGWETETKTQARSLEGRIKRLAAAEKRRLVAGTPLGDVLRLDHPVRAVDGQSAAATTSGASRPSR